MLIIYTMAINQLEENLEAITVTPLKIDLTNNMNSLKKWFE